VVLALDHADHPVGSRIHIQKAEAVIRRIAFFDFDGTITTKDTLLEFIKYAKGKLSFYTGFAINAPVLVAYRLKIISNQRAKESMLRYFFGKMDVMEFEKLCNEFSTKIIPGLIRPKAQQEINKLKLSGTEVVIVSASPQNWISGWSTTQDLMCIATRLLIEDNRITGKILGKNCHGEEKVNRIRAHFDLSQYAEIYCYGDTKGDLPMLALGTVSFFKPFT
jgi:phosphatidylglycerophosphatase C